MIAFICHSCAVEKICLYTFKTLSHTGLNGPKDQGHGFKKRCLAKVAWKGYIAWKSLSKEEPAKGYNTGPGKAI